MKRLAAALGQAFLYALVAAVAVACYGQASLAKGNGYQRAFPQSKAVVEKVLREMQAPVAGRLPTLEGFATSADRPLDRYQRGYYQCKVQVRAAPSGGSVVWVSAEVTAWYADPVASHSGYQLLTSNGRLEADLLDQLSDQLVAKAAPIGAISPAGAAMVRPSSAPPSSAPTSSAPASSRPASSASAVRTPDASEPTISAPMPRIPETGAGPSSLAQGLSGQADQKSVPEKVSVGLRDEEQSLEEVLKNQSHPKNLVAVKKSGTPVVEKASLTAKTLFLASAHDEFEMLDFTRDWVHVRISGLSRGWIWRNNLEMPDSVPYTDTPASAAPGTTAAEVFHVVREEQAPFPGDWGPLRGKRVKIVSVEKIDENAKDAGPRVRLEFAKSVLDSSYAELAQKTQELAGIVLIFDSADGGMIASTFPVLQQWKAGTLSDAALWHQSFFDPPEIFSGSGSSASQ
ncbi:MAG: hypothetical protein WAL89_01460 [Candidatus Sulfotelmatobacter sp.]|jgi:hypothetical protein